MCTDEGARMMYYGGRDRAMLICTPAETLWLQGYQNLLATECSGGVEKSASLGRRSEARLYDAMEEWGE